jgi:transcriptional regulator with XRE-family HTH domain
MTMEQKIQKRYRTWVLGFPMVLQNVPMEKIRGEWAPAINFNELEDVMALVIPLKRARLTGSELRFLRQHLDLSQEAFAAQFDYTRQGVKKWEDCGDTLPALKWSTERDIRLFALSRAVQRKGIDPAAFLRAYELLTRKAPAKIIEIVLAADKVACMADVLAECLEAS